MGENEIDQLRMICKAISDVVQYIVDFLEENLQQIIDEVINAIERATKIEKKRPPRKLLPYYAGCVQKVRRCARSNC